MALHGGDIYDLQKSQRDNIIDYSSNINPLGLSETFKAKVMENFHLLTRYPDIEYRELRDSLAHMNSVGRENILVGNGAVEVLFLYAKALNPKKALIVSPTFREYERALKNTGCQINYYKLEEEKEFQLDADHLISQIRDEDLVVLCNPNNPTGKFISLQEIDKLSRFLEKKGAELFIDECFIEFIPEWKTLSSALLGRKNIFILRAFTKFFAIPGLRLGYGITFNPCLAEKISSSREPWSVNTFAELGGIWLPQDEDYIERSYLWIREEKKWFFQKLSQNKNIRVFSTETNFILLKLLHLTAEELREKMIRRGYLIRNASNFQFLNDSFVRLAIKDRKNNMKLIDILEEETALPSKNQL